MQQHNKKYLGTANFDDHSETVLIWSQVSLKMPEIFGNNKEILLVLFTLTQQRPLKFKDTVGSGNSSILRTGKDKMQSG